MRTRIKYSQNFLTNAGLVNNILSKSSINHQDTVLEIGAGEGIITQELLKRAKKVIAYEVDNNWYHKLSERFLKAGNKLEVIGANFLTVPLPNFPYKVFSNIPFNITADVIKKLVFSNNPPEDIYLITQKEAAAKFLGKPVGDKNSLLSIVIGNIFGGSVFYTFRKTNFSPIPAVDIVMLRLKRLERPHAEPPGLFSDFAAFGFSQFEPNIHKGLGKVMSESLIVQTAKENNFYPSYKPSKLDLKHWLALFNKFLANGNTQKVAGSYKKILLQQSKLQKVHRTRVDKNWKRFSE
ncbi:MAG TPA: rRNA adenine N(6)-methyltransferase family protein [Candidatus Bathyarchaeia archaeon]|nr:rRNA adenine N(6)-methyltransferase family protein [Candidatus Bathyarchaeia archaeon]